MAIKIKHLTDLKPLAVKEFTDRVESRKAFWSRYTKMVAEGSTIITFFGAGGVGKTTLLKKIEEEINHRDAELKSKCKYVNYDLAISVDPHNVLKAFKFQLAAYGCTFPLFDAGNYYYSLKTGQNITPPKAKSMMEKIPWLNNVRKRVEKANKMASKASPLLNTAKHFFEETNDVLKTFPIMRTITTCFSIVDYFLLKYMESRQILDDDHKKVRFQMNSRFHDKNPVILHEYLPILFAMDVADWLHETKNKLVIFLDNYEMLISSTMLATEEQLKRDLWLRGDDGLIFMIPNTLWTIAGRNKLHWEGELAEENEQHLIKALSLEDSDLYLQRAGIENENLRKELVDLTEGYPIFLDLCVDFYAGYKKLHENDPTIAEFGKKRDEVIARIFRYLDADKDDVAKDMIEFLCILNVWTDEIAIDIGREVLSDFSRNTYKRVCEFTYIRNKHAEHEDIDLNIYHFDKTIQSIIFGTCDKKLVSDVKTAIDAYFKKFFADEKIFDAKSIFYLKMWTKFKVRLTEGTEIFKNQYDHTLKDIINGLIGSTKYTAAEEFLILLMNKIADANSEHYAALEMYFSDLRRAQGKNSEAYELAKSAYDKFSRLFGDENPKTIDAMQNLAVTLDDLGRHDEALTLNEKILAFMKENLGKEHVDTVNAADSLATTLKNLEKYDEALILQEKILSACKNLYGDEHHETFNAIQNLAEILSKLGRHDEALTLNQKVLAFRKENFGTHHVDTINAADSLAMTLKNLGKHDEALILQEKILSACKNLYGDANSETVNAIQKLSATLSELGRHDEALTLNQEVLTTRKEILGDEHPKTLDAMKNLAETLKNRG